jgi:hypothetical protein
MLGSYLVAGGPSQPSRPCGRILPLHLRRQPNRQPSYLGEPAAVDPPKWRESTSLFRAALNRAECEEEFVIGSLTSPRSRIVYRAVPSIEERCHLGRLGLFAELLTFAPNGVEQVGGAHGPPLGHREVGGCQYDILDVASGQLDLGQAKEVDVLAPGELRRPDSLPDPGSLSISGIGNMIMNVIRRRKASSSWWRMLVARMATPW